MAKKAESEKKRIFGQNRELMKKRFIVLVDFSELSKWLLLFAHTWSKNANAGMLVMHQASEPVPRMAEAEIVNRMRREQETEAAEKLKYFAINIIGDDPLVKYHATNSHFATAIEQLGDSAITDYIVAGVKDKSAIERLFAGDTADKLSEDLDKIVIACPANSHEISIHELCVGIKAKYPVSESALDDLLSIKEGTIGKVKFFSVLPHDSPADETEAYLRQLSGKYANTIETSYAIVRHDNAAAGCLEFIAGNKGMLVLQRGPRRFADIFRKFFTTEMIRQSRVPVIILP